MISADSLALLLAVLGGAGAQQPQAKVKAS